MGGEGGSSSKKDLLEPHTTADMVSGLSLAEANS